MAKRFKKSTQDDFGGMLGIAAQLENGDTAKVISRFAENINDENHHAIQNFDRMNMALSKVYATINSNEERIYWSPDDMTENSNVSRGQHDRYVWAGEFKKDGVTKNTVFKGTSIDDDNNVTTNTDGMMMIPSPYYNFRESGITYTGPSNMSYISGGLHHFSHTTQQEAIRITIKSARGGGLEPKKFIPLFGYVKGHFDFTRGPFVNSSGRYYRPGVQRASKINTNYSRHNSPTNYADSESSYAHLSKIRKYADIPCAIAGKDTPNNLYKLSIDNGKRDVNAGALSEANDGWWHRFANEFHRNTIIWFMYAWENIGGQDKGMIITTAGEAPCYSHRHTTVNGSGKDYQWYGPDGCYRHRPTNAHYGNKDGFLQWEAPADIRKIIDDGGGLQDVYNKYNDINYLTDKYFQDTDPDSDDPRRAFRNRMPYIHMHHKDAHSEILGGYPNGLTESEDDGDGPNVGKWTETWRKTKDGGYYGYFLGQKYGYGYMNNYTTTSIGYASTRDWDYPAHSFNLGMNWAPSHIVSFGDIAANANLQNPEEILIDANTIVAALDQFEGGVVDTDNHSGNRYSGDLYQVINSPLLGLNAKSTYRFGSSAHNSWNNGQVAYVGSGPSTEYRARAGGAAQILYSGSFLGLSFRDVPGQFWQDWAKWYYSVSYHGYEVQPGGANAIALRPVFDQEIEIHGFSFASYEQDILDDDDPNDKKTISQRIEGNGAFQYFFRSSDDTTYTFTSSGHSYDPLLEAKGDPARLSNDTEWTNKANLIDGDVSTRAQLDAAGEQNALYIELSDSEATIATPADFDVQSFSIGVRGVTLAANANHKLRLSVVSDTNNDVNTVTLFTTTASDGTILGNDKADISDVPMNNSSISPAGDGMYLINFKSTSGSPVDYSQIQNAYLKIWAEEVS